MKITSKITRKHLDEINQVKYQKNGLVGILTRKYISSNLTRLLSRTSLTPNQITLISFFIGLSSFILIASGNPYCLPFAGLLLYFSKVFDSIDGEIARLKHLESARGAWIDGISDRFKENLLIFSITFGLYRQTNDPKVWIYGFIAVIALHMLSIVLEHTGKMDKGILQRTQEDTFIVKIAKKLNLRSQFFALQADTYLFITALLVIFNQLFIALLFYLIIINVYWLMIVLFVFLKKGKEETGSLS
jgi:phosphatidylglycerophosphate synthase